MTTKMKDLLKGLRYISQIFDEEKGKEKEMKIGFPTDVKHVAHIGWDGPTVDSPSWMKEFNSSTGFQSAPLGPPPNSREDREIKWVSEDSKRGHKSATSSPAKDDVAEMSKSARRHSDKNSSNDSPKKQKSRQSRKHQAKDSSNQPPQESTSSLPNIPRKSRRKKSKELNDDGGSTRSRSKGTSINHTENVYSEPGGGPDTNNMSLKPRSRLSPVPSLDDEENEIRLTYKD